jgi:hypothetical protein
LLYRIPRSASVGASGQSIDDVARSSIALTRRAKASRATRSIATSGRGRGAPNLSSQVVPSFAIARRACSHRSNARAANIRRWRRCGSSSCSATIARHQACIVGDRSSGGAGRAGGAGLGAGAALAMVAPDFCFELPKKFSGILRKWAEAPRAVPGPRSGRDFIPPTPSGKVMAPFQSAVLQWRRVSIATGPDKPQGPATSAMPRKRRPAVKKSPVAMGQNQPSKPTSAMARRHLASEAVLTHSAVKAATLSKNQIARKSRHE